MASQQLFSKFVSVLALFVLIATPSQSVTYYSNGAELQNLICQSASSLTDCQTCIQTLGTAPNFFVGDSALQQTFMVGLAACMQASLPSSHQGCVNSLVPGSSTDVTPSRVGGIFGVIGDIISTLNVLELSWVRMAQAQSCVLLANIGLNGK